MMTAACGGDVTPVSVTIAQNLQDPGSLERAYVKCFEGHGVDAHIAEGGGIQFDSGGNLSMEETQALIEECQEQLEQLGLRIQPEIDDDWLGARFEEIEAVRDCLLDHEQPVPDLVSLETYLEDPDVQPNTTTSSWPTRPWMGPSSERSSRNRHLKRRSISIRDQRSPVSRC